MGNVSMTIHAVGSHHNHDNPHDLNKMFARFVDDLKAKGHNVVKADLHHGGHEDMLDDKTVTRAGVYGPLSIAALTGLSLFAALLAGAIAPAYATDQNPPAKPVVKAAAAAPAAPSPFYMGAWVGAGFSKTQNELTLAGAAQGPISAYPTGIMPGFTIGYANNSAPIYWGAEIDVGYDFSRGDIGGVAPNAGLGAPGYRKNGFFLAEVAEVGISATTFGGYIPSNAQPQNWPVPITVPGSVWNNLVFAARGGFAQRNVDLCAVDAAFVSQCASKFINGPLAGAKVKAMISANTEVFVTYDHIFWNSSFTPAGATPLFANTTAAKDEDLFRVGFGYHF
jgi:hypothetical protein